MSKKIMMLALAAVSAALFALPAVASADFLHAEKAVGGGLPGHFSGTGELSELTDTNGLRLHGKSTTVTGAFETTTTGWMEITFHEVTGPLGFPCTTSEQPSGTVKTTKLTFHLVTLPGDLPGVLITPNHETGIFAHFSCAGIARTVGGNGILGTITSPGCGESSSTAGFSFKPVSMGHQLHKFDDTGNGPYFLKTGEVASSMDAGAIITFAQSTKLVCT